MIVLIRCKIACAELRPDEKEIKKRLKFEPALKSKEMGLRH